MMDWMAVALDWAAATGVPNILFVVALLTKPSTWSQRLVGVIDSRLGDSGQ